MRFQLELAAQYLRGRKLRSFLTTLAIVIGVMVIFGTGVLMPTIMRTMQQGILSAAGQVDATIVHKTGEAFSLSVLNKVKRVDGVGATAGSVSRPMNIPPNFYGRDVRVLGVTLTGVDPEAGPTVRTYNMSSGRFLEEGDREAAVIASSLADAIGLKLGDTLKLPTPEGVVKLEIVGLRPGRGLVGNEEVLVTLDEAQRLLDMSGYINVVEANLTTKDPAQREQIFDQIEARLGRHYTLNTLPSGSEVFAAIGTSEAAFKLFGFLTLFMGGFIIFNTFRTIVAERRHDIGMLRAIGAGRRTIIGLILAEGLVQGIAGTAVGLALGYLLGRAMISFMGPVYEQ